MKALIAACALATSIASAQEITIQHKCHELSYPFPQIQVYACSANYQNNPRPIYIDADNYARLKRQYAKCIGHPVTTEAIKICHILILPKPTNVP